MDRKNNSSTSSFTYAIYLPSSKKELSQENDSVQSRGISGETQDAKLSGTENNSSFELILSCAHIMYVL